MRKTWLFLIPLIAGCTNEANHLGNPLLLPINGLATAAQNAVYDTRRGRVEVFVKSNHPALMADIMNGGGATLDQAMDIARVPAGDRPARITQLNGDAGLYAANPGALVVALMVYGG